MLVCDGNVIKNQIRSESIGVVWMGASQREMYCFAFGFTNLQFLCYSRLGHETDMARKTNPIGAGSPPNRSTHSIQRGCSERSQQVLLQPVQLHPCRQSCRSTQKTQSWQRRVFSRHKHPILCIQAHGELQLPITSKKIHVSNILHPLEACIIEATSALRCYPCHL